MSRSSSVERCNFDMEYLRSHSNNLNEQENTIPLIDEVYTAQNIENRNGKFVGFSDNDGVVKIVLIFSCSKYNDVVCAITFLSLRLLITFIDD